MLRVSVRVGPRIMPFGAVLRGLIAGAAGSLAQSLFFRATAKVTPSEPPGVFDPPEPPQAKEQPTETVARRVVEDLMERGPLPETQKRRGGTLVHYLYGAAWGAVYGLARESAPVFASLAGGGALFGGGVYAVSDALVLPAFRLGPPATKLPAKNHLYMLAAHVVYGLAVWAAYVLLRDPRRVLSKVR